jgi:hypothetical protein
MFNGQEDPENPVCLSEKRFITFFFFSKLVSVNISIRKRNMNFPYEYICTIENKDLIILVFASFP